MSRGYERLETRQWECRACVANPGDKCLGPAIHFDAVVFENVRNSMVEERVAESLDRRVEIGSRLGAKAARGKAREDLIVE